MRSIKPRKGERVLTPGETDFILRTLDRIGRDLDRAIADIKTEFTDGDLRKIIRQTRKARK